MIEPPSPVEREREIDFARLRAERRRRLGDAMESAGLDAMVLGRPANVRYASGARQLWTAGTRPFSPACVVLRDPAEVHLLSVWDEGVPVEIDHHHLFGPSWDPARLTASLASIAALVAAEMVGTDGMTPLFAELLPSACPKATIVDASPALRAARASKTVDEVACIATAVAVAEAALLAAARALRPGVTERELLAIVAEHAASAGVPILASESAVCATPPGATVVLHHIPTDRPIGEGELTALTPAVLYAGYEGTAGRTFVSGRETSRAQRLAKRCRTALDAVVDECRAGRTGADLCRAWQESGEALPPLFLAHGLGLGAEPPLIGDDVGQQAVVVAGAVLTVQGWVAEDDTGGWLERDVVVVGEHGPRVLTSREPRRH